MSASQNIQRIAIVIPYFGKFPEWAPLYFETLKKNSTIDFIFFTDCDTAGFESPNISFQVMSFADYIQQVNRKTNLGFKPSNAYKLCDLRPLFGMIHEDILRDYDFYGWTDMDILFGDIRSFYTDDILQRYDVFSTHSIRLSGHFSLFRNNLKNRMMYHKIYGWKAALAADHFVGIDEHGITNAYLMTFFDRLGEKLNMRFDNAFTRRIAAEKRKRLYLKEQFTTPFTSIPWLDGTTGSAQPDTWFYRDGTITNTRDGARNFMYLHFMNFKSSLWRHDGTKAPWEGKETICAAVPKDLPNGIIIDRNGIRPA